jgi:hypothetical protein
LTPTTGRRPWDPQPGDAERIAEHLRRQADLPADRVRLDDGRVVPVGSDAAGEGDYPTGWDVWPANEAGQR